MDGDGLRLNMNGLDYLILALYFVTVLGVGFAARRAIRTSVDFFLSGRSLPAWVTGLAFVSANLGALEIIGMAANGAQYGVMTVHYYWIGAVPAMVFLGIVMMPFYYGSKVRSVPEYLRLRFNRPTHLLNAISFARRPGADRRREPVRAGPGHAGAARLAALDGDRGRRGDRAGVHHHRRPVRRDLQRGAPVLRHPGRPHPGHRDRPGQGRRVERPDGRGRATPNSARPACTRGRTPAAPPTRWARTGSASSSASASCSRSATGRRTSPRCSGRCRPRT